MPAGAQAEQEPAAAPLLALCRYGPSGRRPTPTRRPPHASQSRTAELSANPKKDPGQSAGAAPNPRGIKARRPAIDGAAAATTKAAQNGNFQGPLRRHSEAVRPAMARADRTPRESGIAPNPDRQRPQQETHRQAHPKRLDHLALGVTIIRPSRSVGHANRSLRARHLAPRHQASALHDFSG